MPASDITSLNGWDECKDPEIVDWKRVRRLIEHEDLLVNHRVTWLLLSQGFLLTLLGAMGTVWANAKCYEIKAVCTPLAHALLPMPPLLGLLICLLAAVAIADAERQIRVVAQWWQDTYADKGLRHPAVFRPRPSPWAVVRCFFRYSLLATVFAGFWGALILHLIGLALRPAQQAPLPFTVILATAAILLVYFAHGIAEVNPALGGRAAVVGAATLITAAALGVALGPLAATDAWRITMAYLATSGLAAIVAYRRGRSQRRADRQATRRRHAAVRHPQPAAGFTR